MLSIEDGSLPIRKYDKVSRGRCFFMLSGVHAMHQISLVELTPVVAALDHAIGTMRPDTVRFLMYTDTAQCSRHGGQRKLLICLPINVYVSARQTGSPEAYHESPDFLSLLNYADCASIGTREWEGEGTTGPGKRKKEHTVGDCTLQGNCGFVNRPLEHITSADNTDGHLMRGGWLRVICNFFEYMGKPYGTSTHEVPFAHLDFFGEGAAAAAAAP